MIWSMQKPENDMNSILSYKKGSHERELLLSKIEEIKAGSIEIPLIIDGKVVKTGNFFEVKCPHDHSITLAKAHLAGPKELKDAAESAVKAQKEWAALDWYQRAAIFRKAADILAGPKRIENIAAIMMNQSKTPFEAEIDLAELVDFFNFNAYYMRTIFEIQPEQYPGELNRFDWRPLEGFILAIPPFNFYSIAGNLPTAPAMTGCVSLWKPARSTIFSNYKIMQILIEAGIPAGVINFVPFNSKDADVLFDDPNFAGLHFTGSYETLVNIWEKIGKNLSKYRNFPRIVGETGGKDFIFIHNSADVTNVVMNILRGGFEYQGQKCSACSRVYAPESKWNEIKELLLKKIPEMKYGSTETLDTAGGAIIDKPAYDKVVTYLDYAKENTDDYEFVSGGKYDHSKGWFVDPTIIRTMKPKSKLISEEIFGPVVTVYVYPDEKYEETLKLCDETSPFALTGAIFATDRYAISKAEKILRFSAGNFYINDKPTGAIVGRQPFGGARASGTNDKAGSILNIFRWMSPRTIKETTLKATDWRRPYIL